MISVDTALWKIAQSVHPLPSISTDVSNSLGYILSTDIRSPLDHPVFDQSAVDGYALGSTATDTHYTICGEIPAGTSSSIELEARQCVQVFTGSPVPPATAAVIMQEHTSIDKKILSINQRIEPDSNIRRKGEQIKKNEILAQARQTISAGMIGLLHSVGIREVTTHRLPKVAVVITGSELTLAGKKLPKGHIYESTSGMLTSLLDARGYQYKSCMIGDNLETIQTTIGRCLDQYDAVVVTGGVSVGKYDWVETAVQTLSADILFTKVKQKPGKPFLFAKSSNGKPIFGLPGNPAAAFICFYMYVLPALAMMKGETYSSPQTKQLPLADAFEKKGDKTEFVHARIINDKVHLNPYQRSHMLRNLAFADAIVRFEENPRTYHQGEVIDVYPFDQLR